MAYNKLNPRQEKLRTDNGTERPSNRTNTINKTSRATISSTDSGAQLERLGAKLLRYGLVLVLLWIGLLKFTAYESEGVHGLASNSPILSWLSGLMSVRSFSALIGVIEITLAILIATRRFAPKLSAIGSIGAVVMFLITLSFLLSTPGVWQPGYGFPFLSPNPGQFLIKDILLLGAALYTAGEVFKAFPMA